jgi:multiple sugar transport system substrate-binding protein
VKFIKWFTSTQKQATWAGLQGPKNVVSTFPLPARLSSFNLLTSNGNPGEASTLESIIKTHAQPPFPNGAPPWYVQFSAAVQTNIHQAATGQETVPQAVQAIATEVSTLKSSG